MASDWSTYLHWWVLCWTHWSWPSCIATAASSHPRSGVGLESRQYALGKFSKLQRQNLFPPRWESHPRPAREMHVCWLEPSYGTWKRWHFKSLKTSNHSCGQMTNYVSSHLEVALVWWIISETESESRPRNFQSLMGGGLTPLRQRMRMLLRSGQAERLLRREKTGAEEVTRSLVTEMTAVNLSSVMTSGTSTSLWPRGMRPTDEENLKIENSRYFDDS